MTRFMKMRCLIPERLRVMGRSQGWLSMVTGDARTYVNRICNGAALPLVSKAILYAKALNCTVEQLWVPADAPKTRGGK